LKPVLLSLSSLLLYSPSLELHMGSLLQLWPSRGSCSGTITYLPRGSWQRQVKLLKVTQRERKRVKYYCSLAAQIFPIWRFTGICRGGPTRWLHTAKDGSGAWAASEDVAAHVTSTRANGGQKYRIFLVHQLHQHIVYIVGIKYKHIQWSASPCNDYCYK
jgi:hypothetical protein